MLFRDRARFFGILMGVTLASLVMTQQGSIFSGIMYRASSLITDIPAADIWVMDPKVRYIEDQKPLQSTKLPIVRGVSGIEWAMPLYKGQIKARLANGLVQNCVILGVDDATLVGAPGAMASGESGDLRSADAVLVDEVAATGRLAKMSGVPGEPPTPLAVGDTLELNDHRAIVVGISRMTRSFQNQPTIITTMSRASTMAPPERRNLSYILVKAKPGVDAQALSREIAEQTGLAAYTASEFKWMTVDYFLRYTGIPINFGLSVALGFLVGTVITGFMFYNFTLDNLRYFATFKAMGATDGHLMRMILVQAIVVAVLGYGVGVGLTGLFGMSAQNAPIAFYLTWQLLAVAACAIVSICMMAAVLSLRRVITLEPGVVFKG